MKKRTCRKEHELVGVSRKGHLGFARKVKYGSEEVACRLAGIDQSNECKALEQWRTELATQREYKWYSSAREDRIENRLKQIVPVLPYLRIAFAVRRLRAEERRWPLRGGTTALPPFEHVIEPITGRPGVLCVISGPRRLASKESVDVACAFADLADMAKSGLSDGVSFGATGVRVARRGVVEALVVWDGNRGAGELHDMTTWLHSDKDVGLMRYARRALRREARRLLREAQRHLARRAQQQVDRQPSDEAEAQAD
jgi:hypothetical protein